MIRSILFSLILITLSGCYRKTQGPDFDESLIVPPDSMVSILTDIHILEGIVSTGDYKDSALTAITEKTLNIIFAKHHIDRAAFEENVHYYTYHAEDLDKIYEQVIINLSKLESEVTVGEEIPDE